MGKKRGPGIKGRWGMVKPSEREREMAVKFPVGSETFDGGGEVCVCVVAVGS